ncbi:MAG TPA: FIST N-terminal domain-containing protein [Actinomycetota bacterium]
MFRMAVGHSGDIDPVVAIGEALGRCERELGGDRARAGLLFCTYDTDVQPLVAAVRAAHPDIQLAGSTSAGEMTSVLGFQEDSVALALFASDTIEITAGFGEGVSAGPAAAARAALDRALAGTTQPPRLCIAVPCITGDDPTDTLRELQGALGPDVPVLGGGSAPRTPPDEPRVARQFCNDSVLEDAAVVLLFSGPLSFSFGVDTGWRPIGARGRVTESVGNVIRTIDDEPALAFYQRYLGEGGRPTPANPLAVYEGAGDDFYLRVPLASDVDAGTVVVTGGIPNGVEVRLTVAVTDEIFAGTKSAIDKARAGFPGPAGPAAALVFSCAIRKLVLGTRTGREVDIARTELGEDVPISGFYCFGEIAPIAPGATRFHNETVVAVLIGESA